MIWFTADTHFGHEKIISFCRRPFQLLDDMHQVIIDRWNARIRVTDEVWHLGDFAYKAEPLPFLKHLNGRIHLVLGNHDKPARFAGLVNLVVDAKYLRWEKHRFYLHHYACRVWPKSHRGSFHLYGHSHGELPGIGRSMDVGVDALNFAPISIDEVVRVLTNQEPTNHHPLRNPEPPVNDHDTKLPVDIPPSFYAPLQPHEGSL